MIVKNIGGIKVILKTDDKSKQNAKIPAYINYILNEPEKSKTMTDFIEQITMHLILNGNAYIKKINDYEGKINKLQIINPDMVRIIKSKKGKTEYEIKYNDTKIIYDEKTIIHIKQSNPMGEPYGIGMGVSCMGSIDFLNSVMGHNLSILKNGGRPSGALIIKNQMGINQTREQREDIKDQIKDKYQGRENAGKVLVLEGDCEWKEMGYTQRDMDFKIAEKSNKNDIAMAFGIPGILLFGKNDKTGTSYREARMHFWEDTIIPIANKIMAGISKSIAGSGYYFTYNITDIGALQIKKDQMWDKISNANFLTSNEKSKY